MNEEMEQDNSTKISPVAAGIKGHCPRCGVGALFNGFLEPAKACDHCDLDYEFIDAADGPAVFVILLAGFLIVGLALLVEIIYQPPYWVHAALWLPVGLVVPLAMLRPLKGALIAQQYRNSAKEARFDPDGSEV